jgi:hypothetical protein
MSKLSSLAVAICLAACARGAAAQSEKATAPPQAIDPSWLSVDATTRTATFDLIAGLTGANGALNFNGFKDGGLALTVPVGWTVVMHFRNHDGMLPHSAVVIDDVHPLPLQPVTPAFPKAFTLRLAEGIPSEGRDDLRFIADKGGSYLIFCGVPGHGAAGMWVRLMVSTSANQPSLAATPPGQH